MIVNITKLSEDERKTPVEYRKKCYRMRKNILL